MVDDQPLRMSRVRSMPVAVGQTRQVNEALIERLRRIRERRRVPDERRDLGQVTLDRRPARKAVLTRNRKLRLRQLEVVGLAEALGLFAKVFEGRIVG